MCKLLALLLKQLLQRPLVLHMKETKSYRWVFASLSHNLRSYWSCGTLMIIFESQAKKNISGQVLCCCLKERSVCLHLPCGILVSKPPKVFPSHCPYNIFLKCREIFFKLNRIIKKFDSVQYTGKGTEKYVWLARRWLRKLPQMGEKFIKIFYVTFQPE